MPESLELNFDNVERRPLQKTASIAAGPLTIIAAIEHGIDHPPVQ